MSFPKHNKMIYSPKEDSYLLEKQVKKLSPNTVFLDLGSASGIQAESALKAGAKQIVVADIQDDVVNFLKQKFSNESRIKVIKTNLFSKIKGKFDIIAFNPPYLPLDSREDRESRITTTGGKKGDELILRFLKQSPKHLNQGGFILLVVSSQTPQDRILNLLNSLHLKKKVLEKESFFMETLYVWKISN